jgi:hypothetical protein
MSRLLGALGSDVRLVLVVGDAGVGKTRFVTEGTDRAAAAGTVMLRGECLPLAGTLPLLPVKDALGELASLEGGRLLAAALDAAKKCVGCCPGWTRTTGRDRMATTGSGAGSGCSAGWRTYWPW